MRLSKLVCVDLRWRLRFFLIDSCYVLLIWLLSPSRVPSDFDGLYMGDLIALVCDFWYPCSVRFPCCDFVRMPSYEFLTSVTPTIIDLELD